MQREKPFELGAGMIELLRVRWGVGQWSSEMKEMKCRGRKLETRS